MFHYTLTYVSTHESQIENFVRPVSGYFDPIAFNGNYEVSFIASRELLTELVAWLDAGRILSFCVKDAN